MSDEPSGAVSLASRAEAHEAKPAGRPLHEPAGRPLHEPAGRPLHEPAGRPLQGTEGHGTHSVDVLEHGAPKDGKPQEMNRRLYMQLCAFRWESGQLPDLTSTQWIKPSAPLGKVLGARLTEAGVRGVLYEDVNDPNGWALLSWSEEPADLVDKVRPLLTGFESRPELAMLGRTYSSGYEDDLVFWLLERPVQTVTNPAWPWAVWYPLRRSGAFAQLPAKEQGAILREHGAIGRAYGEADLAHDVRLACHGLDRNDNEFVIGLCGKALHPLSHVVQSMRKTRQTAEYIVQMGPFFVGRRVWSSG